MAHPQSNPVYDPLPLTGEDHSSNLYNAPHSPNALGYSTPPIHTPELSGSGDLPLGAAQPRFLGNAMYHDNPELRQSMASTGTFPMDRGSEYNGSVLALNEHGGRSSTFDSDRYRDDPNNMPMSPVGQSHSPGYMEEKRATYAPPRSRRNVIIGAVVAALILIILAVVIPLYFAVIKPNRESAATGNSNGTTTTTGADGQPTTIPVGNLVKSGGDGSEITAEDGSKFTYKNSFGGTWYFDASDPYNNGAKAQSYTPGLNETFDYSTDRIHG